MEQECLWSARDLDDSDFVGDAVKEGAHGGGTHPSKSKCIIG